MHEWRQRRQLLMVSMPSMASNSLKIILNGCRVPHTLQDYDTRGLWPKFQNKTAHYFMKQQLRCASYLYLPDFRATYWGITCVIHWKAWTKHMNGSRDSPLKTVDGIYDKYGKIWQLWWFSFNKHSKNDNRKDQIMTFWGCSLNFKRKLVSISTGI